MSSKDSREEPLKRLESLGQTTSPLQVLDSLPKWEASSFSPLEVPRQIAQKLGNPQDSFRSIHVAGTNGKGSVCAFLSACLHASQHSVGQFVSPHLTHVTQRCLIAGHPVGENEYALAVEQVLNAAAELSLTPSYFVVTMLASFLVFSQRNLEWGVIEVGLGGVFDATSILHRPELCVITRVGYDHMHWLGTTLEEIAENKAGIIKPGVPVVVGSNEDAAVQVCQRKATEVGSKIYVAGKDFSLDIEAARVELHLPDNEVGIDLGLGPVELKSFHAENRALGIAAARLVGVSPAAISQASKSVCWPGRTETLKVVREDGRSQDVLLDGLHNPQGALAFVEYLRSYLKEFSYSKIHFLISLRSTKNTGEVLEILEGINAQQSGGFFSGEMRFVFTGDDIPLAEPSQSLLSSLSEAGRVRACNIEKSDVALERVLQEAGANELVLILGSLYLIGKLRPSLTDEPFVAISK